MNRLDTLIHNGIVVTVDAQFTILRPGAVGVADGRIHGIWPSDDMDALPSARETIDAEGGVIMPGLVNVHTHLPMALFRGLADDMALERWLHEHIFPAEARHIDERSVVLGTRLSVAEMLLGGITACCDGYFLAGRVAETVVETGMRAVVGQGVIDFPAPGVPDPKANVTVAADFVRQWRQRSPMVQPAIFCHSPVTCSAGTLRDAKAAANDLDVRFLIHAAETETEVRQCRQAHGCGPVAYLQESGVLDASTILVHMVWVDADDIRRVADSGASIVHCPESNMKLASGVAPVPDFLDAGISVGLGTDGSASNNDLSLFGEMDSAAKLQKVHRLDPTVLDAATVVRMATIQGARILGLDRRIGSLEKGKSADLIVVDTRQPHLTPLYHPASHLVYAASAGDVRHVMIGGRWVVRDRRLLTMDLPALLDAGEREGRAIARMRPAGR